MTTAITFSVPAAEAAEHRAEEGLDPQPGDTELITALDGWRSQEWDAYWAPIHQADDQRREAEWLTQQCPICVDGGTGEECAAHIIAEDARMRRAEDQ